MPKRADPSLPAIHVAVAAEGWSDAVADAEARAETAARAALLTAAPFPTGGEVSVVLGDDAMLHELNRAYRGIDKPTNVLSFPMDAHDTAREAWMVGEVAVALETTVREAAEEAKKAEDHLCHLVVHGVLHLLGYDHETDAEAERMEALEARLLARLGVGPAAEPAGPARVPLTAEQPLER